MKSGKAVLCVWEDHTFEFGTFSKAQVMRMTTVGWLVEETDEYVAIALTKRGDNDYAETQTIDKRMVVSLGEV